MEEEEKKEENEGADLPLRNFPHWSAARRKFAPDCCFFSAGNLERELQAKQVSLSITDEEIAAISRLEEEETLQVRCPISGCGATLSSLSDFESHYSSAHRATCSVCFNVYPTTRLLNIHISECHDSFFKAKVARNYPMVSQAITLFLYFMWRIVLTNHQQTNLVEIGLSIQDSK
ncbi:hypothetical protein AXG93_4689s1590 [Marchantia polymorpha subsp. ruderalis]|uniref:C2H2-type domain-containing protein n=1 Tax=Marchantia polymorpha subsp. ruderalis TaxID=1480154 RepID=A0A176WN03_MARPO|nr:hypothetical protein AXG93_4689s1590 [Marchantia polymorpha subsp. ruderalis]